MKKKLDLNGLLSKYQGISNTQTAGYYSPAQGYDYGQNATVTQDFYQSRQINNPPQQIPTYNQPVICNFQMSKSQCQTFLLKLKEELRNQQRQMQNIVQTTHKRIHERFQNNHQKIKRQILELLDKAFKENQRQITQELRRQGNVQPPEFVSVHKQIAAIDDQINGLLYGLKGSEYRQSIANTIMKNFDLQLSKVSQSIINARQSYENSLGQVQPDRARIECLKQDLQRLFKISKKNAGFVNAAFFSIVGGGGDTKQPTSSYSQPPVQSQSQVGGGGQASTRQRKSFFNFMGGN